MTETNTFIRGVGGVKGSLVLSTTVACELLFMPLNQNSPSLELLTSKLYQCFGAFGKLAREGVPFIGALTR